MVPALGATLADLKINYFKTLAVDKDTLNEHGRSAEEQIASLRCYDTKEKCPTNAGILLFGINPEFYLPGAQW